MTHSDYTKNILNIKDQNIYFYENCLENRKDNNIEVKVFHGFLTYTSILFYFLINKDSFVNIVIKLFLLKLLLLIFINKFLIILNYLLF